jgi:hypothetical protein
LAQICTVVISSLNSAAETSSIIASYLHHNSFYVSCFIEIYTNQTILGTILCFLIVFNDKKVILGCQVLSRFLWNSPWKAHLVQVCTVFISSLNSAAKMLRVGFSVVSEFKEEIRSVHTCTRWAFQGLLHKNRDNIWHPRITFLSLKTIKKHKIAPTCIILNNCMFHAF